MTELDKLLDGFGDGEDKKRASQVLKSLEGLSIWEARALLDGCAKALEWMEIHYR